MTPATPIPLSEAARYGSGDSRAVAHLVGGVRVIGEKVPAGRDLVREVEMRGVRSAVDHSNYDGRRAGGDGPCLWRGDLREVPLAAVRRVVGEVTGQGREVRIAVALHGIEQSGGAERLQNGFARFLRHV